MEQSNAFLVCVHEASVDKKHLDSVYFDEFIQCYGYFVGYVKIQLLVQRLIFPMLVCWGVYSVFGTNAYFTVNHKSQPSSSPPLAAICFPCPICNLN